MLALYELKIDCCITILTTANLTVLKSLVLLPMLNLVFESLKEGSVYFI